MTIITPVVQATTSSARLLNKGITPVDNFGPWAGEEFDFAAKHPVLYPLGKTILDSLPLGWAVTPSGRRQFSDASLGGKALTLGLDAAFFLPSSWIGKGLKVVTAPLRPIGRGVKSVLGHRIFPRLENVADASTKVLDDLVREFNDFKFVSSAEKLGGRYGVTASNEVEALMAKTQDVWTVRQGRSGFKLPSEVAPSREFKGLWTKEGKINPHVEKNIDQWSKPADIQRVEHMKSKYESFLGRFVSRKGVEVENVFKSQAARLFGKEASAEMTLKNIGEDQFSMILKDTLLNKGKIIKAYDIDSRHFLLPVRKVLGPFEEMYGTLSKLYDPLVERIGSMRTLRSIYTGMFNTRMAANGLGTIGKKGRFKQNFGPRDWEEAGKVIVGMDKMQGEGIIQSRIEAFMNSKGPVVASIAKSYQEFTDFLYADFLTKRIPALFEKAGMTGKGVSGFETMFRAEAGKPSVENILNEVLAAGNNVGFDQKYGVIRKSLEHMQRKIEKNPDWFKDPKVIPRLKEELGLRGRNETKGLPDYLDNYATRIHEIGDVPGKGKIPKKEVAAGFEKARTAEGTEGLVTDLSRLIDSRSKDQAKRLMLNPYLPQITKDIKTLPPRLKSYANHYLTRLLGNPSKTDEKVAQLINKHFGKTWTARRVQRLSYGINDFIYMGGIGFKPYSVMRNYVQPWLTVPADLGGVKDFKWLARSYGKLLNPKSGAATRDYLKGIGIITEYTPDLLLEPNLLKFGKTLDIGSKSITLPTKDRIRDAALWMFSSSDKHNRFVAGAAAMDKWEYHLKKLAVRDREGRVILTQEGVNSFKKKMNFGSRERWKQAEIENLLYSGTAETMEKAKAVYIKDVVADTQFLYGSLDSPMIASAGGGITRTAFVFQSWWMNYGSLLGKWWDRTGTVDAAINRRFTFLASAAIGYHIMDAMWGSSRAASGTLFGPFPMELDLPPSWRPFADALKTMSTAGGLLIGASDMEQVEGRAKALVKSVMIGVPGGLQIEKSFPKVVEGDLPGLMKTLIGMRD